MATTKLTDAQLTVLRDVGNGDVLEAREEGQSPYFKQSKYWQKPRQAPYERLLADGFITVLPDARVILTDLGRDTLR